MTTDTPVTPKSASSVPSRSRVSAQSASNRDNPQQLSLHNSFCFWLHRLNSALQDSFNEQLRQYDVSWSQWLALNVLSLGIADTPAHIAEQLGVDRSAITRQLDRLEDKGFVERYHDKLDRRLVKVLLTPASRQLMEQVNKEAYLHQQACLADLHRSERRGLKGELQKMLRTQGVDTFDVWLRAD